MNGHFAGGGSLKTQAALSVPIWMRIVCESRTRNVSLQSAGKCAQEIVNRGAHFGRADFGRCKIVNYPFCDAIIALLGLAAMVLMAVAKAWDYILVAFFNLKIFY